MGKFMEAFLDIIGQSIQDGISGITARLVEDPVMSGNGIEVQQGKRYSVGPEGEQQFFQFARVGRKAWHAGVHLPCERKRDL